MDFGTLLHRAQKNESTTKKEIKYYSTKFEPPKKEQRSKVLSANIKKFLERKEQEEKQRATEAKKKKEDLLALRSQDKKATRRVNVMLKRTKSANQSVIQDAIDEDNTAVTLAGPAQPDEDDYGYVSQEASAYYNKMMEKYNKMPDEKKFDFTKKKVSTNLKSTKDRVRAALEKEREEALLPHKRKRKHKEAAVEEEDSQPEEKVVKKEEVKVKPKNRPPPPVMNFADLLKIAEKKQFEPIIIEKKEKKEEEKLLTKKQKKEMEREREWRERKENREKGISKNDKTDDKPKVSDKIPRVGKPQESEKPKIALNNKVSKESSGPILNKLLTNHKSSSVKPSSSSVPPKPLNGGPSKQLSKINPTDKRPKDLQQQKKLPPKELPPKKFPPSDLKPKQFPPKDLKPKQFPPPDVRRMPPKGIKKPAVNKRRILDDDDSEYDSEMDDFIDDGPEENNEYSKYISEIFGYDKSKYRGYDEDDVDNMESNFAQQMREEAISKKIGIMEDLEDMKMEEEQKRRKNLMKKRKL